MAGKQKKTVVPYKVQKKTLKNRHSARFTASLKGKYQFCKSQYVSSPMLKSYISKLKNLKYKKVIQKIYETYTKKILCSKPQKYIYHSGEYTIERYNILDRLPDIPAVKALRNKTYITKKDIETLLESPNISTNNLIFSKFSNIDVIMDLVQNNYKKYSIKYEIILPSGKSIKYEIHLYSKQDDDIVNMVEYGFGIIRRVLFMNYLLNNNELPSRIDIYLTNFKKTLDYSNADPIDSDSVNSAVTDGNNIVIFRKEEALKCLVHELVHFHRLDKKLYNFSLNNMEVNVLLRRLKLSHNIDLDYNHRITEAYTECLATLFSCILSTADVFADIQEYGFTVRGDKQKDQMTEVINCLDYEITFSFQQIAKILKYFKYSRFEDLFKLDPKIVRQPLTQKTDLFSYYILKTYLILNVFDLLDEIRELDGAHRINQVDVVGFVEESVENILDFSSQGSRIMIDGVNRYMSKYKGTKKKNLRMTCLN